MKIIAQQIREELASNGERCKLVGSGEVAMAPVRRLETVLRMVGKQIRLMSVCAKAAELQRKSRKAGAR